MSVNCKVIKITTPQKHLLNGLWFGVNKPKRVIIFVHGLSGTAFSNHELVVPLANMGTAVITFSNRGHDKISKIKKLDQRKKKGYSSIKAGEVHEVFTDCVDDIQGVIDFVKGRGIKELYLVGHSTGCQKSVYYLSRRGKQKYIKGVVLLCPVSDYAAIQKFVKPQDLSKAERKARLLVKRGKPHELLPLDVWPHYHDAQRFLSLYTPNSKEEIFTYCQPDKVPHTLRKVNIPTLAIYAGDDEYRDRPVTEIAQWLVHNAKAKDLTVAIVENAPHNFKNFEEKVVREIRAWLRTH